MMYGAYNVKFLNLKSSPDAAQLSYFFVLFNCIRKEANGLVAGGQRMIFVEGSVLLNAKLLHWIIGYRCFVAT